MALNSPKANQIFQTQFAEFKRNHDFLSQHANLNKHDFENIFPRELRLFRVRLRIAIGLKIGFDKSYAMVKNEPTEKTYIEIMKLNEAWFSWEAMVLLLEKLGWKKNTNSKFDILDNLFLIRFGEAEVIDLLNDQLRNNVYSSASISQDIENYLTFLEGAVDRNTLKNVLQSIKNKVKMRQDWEHKDVSGVIYANRNIFVHQGESAKSGIKYYKNKTLLLKMLFDYMILFQLKVGNCAFDEQITNHGIVK